MVGVLRETSQSAAVAILFTPAESRNRGYATAALAAVARTLVQSGRRCFLYTEPANAATNAIGERLGFERALDAADIDIHGR
jgi:predicted GNAT family acetyltransferase